MKLYFLSVLSVAPIVAAHFKLDYPKARGENEDLMTTFPCGGLAQSTERTKVSISDCSFPVTVTMGHMQTAFEVLLSLGNDPSDNFNITLMPTFGAKGLGSLCLPHVKFNDSILGGVNITDGMNATLQVQSNGDPTGGLYACADIQFSSDASNDDSSCKNNTKVTAAPFTGESAKLNANESTAIGQAQTDGSSSSSSKNSAAASTRGAVAIHAVIGAMFAGAMPVL